MQPDTNIADWYDLARPCELDYEKPFYFHTMRINKVLCGIGYIHLFAFEQPITAVATRYGNDRGVMAAAAVESWFLNLGLLKWRVDLLRQCLELSRDTDDERIDFVRDLALWSQITFGLDKDRGPRASLQHLVKEVQEAMDNPKDIVEFADLHILVVDAARRAGHAWPDVMRNVYSKMDINRHRDYPFPVGDAISEHERSADKPKKRKPYA